MTDPPHDATTYITQVQDHTLSLAARLAEVSIARKEEEDVYCIYNMRGVRRDLRRRDAKLIPEPFAVHFKNGYMHVPWDQMTNWPWIPVSEVIGDDWEYRAIPVHDLDAGFLDWILAKIRLLLEEQARDASQLISRAFGGPYMSFVREDVTYFILPPGKLSTPDLHALKQRVGDWLVAKTDIFAGLQISSQWNHTLYFLLLSGFSHNSKWEKRIQSANQTVIISASCVPLRPDDAPEEEFAKILVFDQKPMRRTAWNHIWIPYDQIGLESLKSTSPSVPGPAHEPTSASAEADKVPDGVPSTAENEEAVGPDATWGIPDQGLKVWLRRTFIFQLMSVPDRY